MSVITISRQLGSQGLAVAQLTAERLGFHLVWRDLINQAALRAGEPEMALAVIDELGLLAMKPTPEASDAYHTAIRQVILEFAKAGKVVILGRAGQAILQDWPGAFHVRIYAPAAYRAQNIAGIHEIAYNSAMAQIETSDRYRKNYLKRYYQVRWDDPNLYDLQINTVGYTPECAAEIICTAYRNQLGSAN
jgi:cytidylate kinase